MSFDIKFIRLDQKTRTSLATPTRFLAAPDKLDTKRYQHGILYKHILIVSLIFPGLSIWTNLNVHLLHFLKAVNRTLPTLMTLVQPDKYAYFENENDQNVIFP